jgi:hypothetical protein
MKRHTRGPALAVALSILFASSATAQTLALHGPPTARPGAELAASYRVRLQSAWPQLPTSTDCENGGSETLEGVLTRTRSGDYSGTFTRSTRLLFCGAHGTSGEACALVLEGDGQVAMHGIVVDGASLRAEWTPAAKHVAEVRGACDESFKQGVHRMYLTVRHGVEFALPPAGAAPRRERLEDYAWIVEVE